VAISPLFFLARFRLGQLLLERGDAAGAIIELEAAAKAAPKEADPVLLLAKALRAEGRLRDAVALAQKGAALAPERPDAWLFVGSLAAEAEDLPALREALERARPLVGENAPPLLLLVARRQRLEGHHDEALATLTQLLRRHPGSALAAEALLSTAREAGREKEAQAFLDALRPR
jgi:predicted Zn-dependent protease